MLCQLKSDGNPGVERPCHLFVCPDCAVACRAASATSDGLCEYDAACRALDTKSAEAQPLSLQRANADASSEMWADNLPTD
jgi:hypothetical protein